MKKGSGLERELCAAGAGGVGVGGGGGGAEEEEVEDGAGADLVTGGAGEVNDLVIAHEDAVVRVEVAGAPRVDVIAGLQFLPRDLVGQHAHHLLFLCFGCFREANEMRNAPSQ